MQMRPPASARIDFATLLPHVEHALEVSRAGYSAGRAEFGDIIDAQRMVLDVGVQYRRRGRRSHSRWRGSIGPWAPSGKSPRGRSKERSDEPAERVRRRRGGTGRRGCVARVERRCTARLASLFRRGDPPAAPLPVTGSAPAPVVPVEPQGPPRVPVTLDARRQQLIGVRTHSRRARGHDAGGPRVGTVRADETRQTEVNVKADGWIRGLRADFTGRAVEPGRDAVYPLQPRSHRDPGRVPAGAPRADAGDCRRRCRSCATTRRVWSDAARERLRRWDMAEEEIQELEQRGAAFETVPCGRPRRA